MPDESFTVAENVPRVRERMANAARRAGRSSESVRLIAVTKTQPAERVAEAAAAGVTDFGENYVQEARAKVPEVAVLTDEPIRWHLIGQLQSNKAKYCVGLFASVQSVDSISLTEELARQAAKRGQTQAILLEVNLSGEARRGGVAPDALPELVERVRGLPALRLEGLMGMAPVTETVEATRPHFRRLYRLWETLPDENRRVLSMGMSGDFEVAIEEGATHVRIGTALFGRRQTRIGGQDG
jgi:PLP dependent protein